MNKRLQLLESLVNSGKADDFARYGLAMEYRREGRVEEAIAAFAQLREQSPNYLAQYLMAAQTLVEAGRSADAKPWLEAGIDLARRLGEGKALGELETALADLDDA